jgi:hypothetical protein
VQAHARAELERVLRHAAASGEGRAAAHLGWMLEYNQVENWRTRANLLHEALRFYSIAHGLGVTDIPFALGVIQVPYPNGPDNVAYGMGRVLISLGRGAEADRYLAIAVPRDPAPC